MPQVVPRAGLGSIDARHVRAPWTLPVFAFLVSVCFVLVPIVDPSAAFALSRETGAVSAPGVDGPSQTLTAGEAEIAIERDQFGVSKYHATAPAVGRPDPGTAKAIAYEMVLARGWDDAQYSCLVKLWERESHWNVNAHNARSGAHGIPQALPGSKMASVAADWETNPVTQITWGLGYIQGRYGDPCSAWSTSEAKGWY